MAKYFDQFPLVSYNINRSDTRANQYDQAVNIFVRFRILTEKLNQVFHYYEYTIKESDTPEILAEKVYGDAEAHWVILMTNNIVDPLYGWPMGYDAFNNYIINKYGSPQIAATTVHHYEVITILEDTTGGETITKKQEITSNAYSSPQSTYSTLPIAPGAPTVVTINGQNVNVYEYKNIVYCDTYEEELNESKRQIKLIKPDYYPLIKNELANMLLTENNRVGMRVVV